MKFKKTSALLCILLLCNCHKEPTACFEIESDNPGKNNEAKVLDNITFRNCSKDANEYNWDFGDGKKSISANPSHTYSKGGEYTITLETHGKGGDQLTKQNISIVSLNGNWEGAFKIGSNAFLFYLKLSQEGKNINGTFELDDGSATSTLKPSEIDKDNVEIAFNVNFELKTYLFLFQGNTNSSLNHIEGSFYINGNKQGTWSANKFTRKSKRFGEINQICLSDIENLILSIQ